MKRLGFLVVVLTMLGLVAVPSGARTVFPERIPLPDGFYPEGIVTGAGPHIFVGSLLDGAIFRGDVFTGSGRVINEGAVGRVLVGLEYDHRSGLLWAVGSQGGAGAAFLFDPGTGELVDRVEVGAVFPNDLVVTRRAAYVTDSLDDVLWRIPLDHGRPVGKPEAVPLGGDFEFVTEGPLPINLNGVVAARDGGALVAVHTALGVLYRIDPETGTATMIDLGGASVAGGDGLVLRGRELYVVQGGLDQITEIRLDATLTSGQITEVISSDLLRFPSTADVLGPFIYAVNARFDVAPPPLGGGPTMSVDYDVVRLRR